MGVVYENKDGMFVMDMMDFSIPSAGDVHKGNADYVERGAGLLQRGFAAEVRLEG